MPYPRRVSAKTFGNLRCGSGKQRCVPDPSGAQHGRLTMPKWADVDAARVAFLETLSGEELGMVQKLQSEMDSFWAAKKLHEAMRGTAPDPTCPTCGQRLPRA